MHILNQIAFWSLVIGYLVWVVALTKDFLFDRSKKWWEAFLIPIEPLFVWYFMSRYDGMIQYLKKKKWIND